MSESSQSPILAGKGPFRKWDLEEGLALVRHQAEAQGDFRVDMQLNIARMAQDMGRDPQDVISLFMHAGMLAAREAKSHGHDMSDWETEPGEVIDGNRDVLLQPFIIEPPKIEIFRITDYGDEPVTNRAVMRLVDTKADWPQPETND